VFKHVDHHDLAASPDSIFPFHASVVDTKAEASLLLSAGAGHSFNPSCINQVVNKTRMVPSQHTKP